MKFIDITGHKYNKLLVLRQVEDINGRKAFECLCDCGNLTKTTSKRLRNGNTKTCGCLYKTNAVKHRLIKTPEYYSWVNMKTRCLNKKCSRYKDYGGRGIKICNEWIESFEQFYADMGPKPEPKNMYSIDRINNDGDYEPSNCKWSTVLEQANNKTKSEKARIQKMYAKRYGVSYHSVRRYVTMGMAPHHAAMRSLKNKISI